MRVCPRPLLLGLLIIFYLQSCVDGQRPCCFRFNTKQIPVAMIGGYKVTGPNCAKHGLIFTTTRGPVCVNPISKWVKDAMKKVDCRIVEEECSSTLHTSPIPVALLSEYKERGFNCENSRVVFYTTKGRVCMDPSSKWVRRAMDIIDRRIVEDECCYSLFSSPLPVSLFSEYKRTGTDCTHPGVILTTDEGTRVCADPSVDWVKEITDTIDRQIQEFTQNSTKWLKILSMN